MEEILFFRVKDFRKVPSFAQMNERTHRRKYKEIKAFFNKPYYQKLTVMEVAAFLGISDNQLISYLQDKKA
jgi:hypothetical protein